jgi:hypothetical protein
MIEPSAGSRSSILLSAVKKATMTSASPRDRRLTSTCGGRSSRNAGGAESSVSRDPSLMPSFVASGVPE